jgi:hypothetical protein
VSFHIHAMNPARQRTARARFAVRLNGGLP